MPNDKILDTELKNNQYLSANSFKDSRMDFGYVDEH